MCAHGFSGVLLHSVASFPYVIQLFRTLGRERGGGAVGRGIMQIRVLCVSYLICPDSDTIYSMQVHQTQETA
jgi:hypothetical protein